MCQKRSSVEGVVFIDNIPRWIRVDSCIRYLPLSLSMHGYNPVAYCCGHGRYPLTVVCRTNSGKFYELISGTNIPRTRNFYKMDKDGYYYIPEIDK